MIETVKDKYQYERLTVDGNKTSSGWYSADDGQVSFQRIGELNKIQAGLKVVGIHVTLKEAEYCWSSYCSDVYHANWIPFPGCVVSEFEEYAKEYFEIEVSKND